MKSILETQKNLEINLKKHVELISPKSSFKEVYEYAVIPPGKLFRPLLVMGIYEDFGGINSHLLDKFHNHSLLASAIEIHHTYTLIHDDLPSMDDDDERRGRASTHKKFGEWQAILAGDGLLNASYHLLSKIKSNNTSDIIKLISYLLGPKGLIEGQVIDLAGIAETSFYELKKMHEYKTSRLIQSAICGSYLLIKEKPEYREFINLVKLGKHMGLVFQFLDDLTELVDEKLPPHEKKINPWLNHQEKSEECLNTSLDRLLEVSNKYYLNSFRKVLKVYFNKINTILEDGKENISKHTGNNEILIPIMSRLNTLCELND